jgi:glycosyltransferase involved in cell wall biosynthesis
MPYKILITLTPSFDPNAGGVQRSTYKMSSEFKKNGHETHVFTFKNKGNKPQDVAKLHQASENRGPRNQKNIEQLKQLILDLKPDIVINQMPYEKEVGLGLQNVKKSCDFLLLCCLRNTLFSVILNVEPYINSIVPNPFNKLFHYYLGRKIFLYLHKRRHKKDLKFILDTYDYFVLFGPPNIDELKYFVGNYKLDKTYFIPNSILNVLDKVPKKEKRILWLSRVTYKQKRADLILPLWKKIMSKLPDWEFDIVGNGDAFDDLKSQIQQENIPRVNMYGKQVPYEYYERSPIYIMTSAYEGFPNTLIEAQSHGCIPIVYDTYPICSWVLKKGKTGVLIPPYDVDKMAEKVINLALDQNSQDKLMLSSLNNAREFHIENVGKKWLDFFRQNVGNSK